MKIKTIGILTGGGDAPGLNPAVKAVVYKAAEFGVNVVGIYDGWQGLLDGFCEETMALEPYVVRRWDRDGGTNIGSSRTNPFRIVVPGEDKPIDRSEEVIKNIHRLGLDALIVLGGEDTLGVAHRLFEKGVPTVGIPKTIDKDLSGTDYTLGFDSAVRNCVDIIERVRTPAGSHHWVQVVEVMGRHAGHLALWGATAGGAMSALIPEYPFRYERLYELLEARLSLGTRDRRFPRYAVIVVAEGATAKDEELVTIDDQTDAFGHVRLGGIGSVIADRIRRHTPYEARAVILGHAQRGGTPSAIDRLMGRLFGIAAVEAVMDGAFGKMVSSRGIAPACDLSLIDLSEAVNELNLVDVDRYYDTVTYAAK